MSSRYTSNKLTNNLLIPLAIIVISVLLAYYLIISRDQAEERPVEIKPILVKALQTQPESVTVILPSQGEVQPRTATLLAAEVSGQVNKVSDNFLNGGFFRKGDMLLEIDNRNYIARAKRAEAAVAQAKSQLAQEKGRAEVAAEDFKKHNKANQLSPDARELALRKPQLAEAKALLDSAIAELQQAQNDLNRTIIRAPYDGLIKEKHVDIGQFVNMGSPIADTFAVDYAEVRLPVSENHLPFLNLPDSTQQQNETVSISLTQTINGEKHSYPAELVRTEGVLDPKSRVLFVIAKISDPYRLNNNTQTQSLPLRIGSFVEANINGKTLDNITVVPRHTLRAGNKIWTIVDNKLVEHKVKVVPVPGNNALISEGLPANSVVCLTSVGPVMPGTAVEIVE